MLKHIFKRYIIEKFSVNFLERALSVSNLGNNYAEVRNLKSYQRREDLWGATFKMLEDTSITLLEFGVYKGYSIKFFSNLNSHKASTFYGFDSFIGLPEDWSKNEPKGAFDTMGKLPETNDERVNFVKGWFQNTLPLFLSNNQISENVVVHFDADIYSATLFLMLELDKLKQPYVAIFDEFYGPENRALYNYCQMTSANVEFFGKVENGPYPAQVSCKISPSKNYSVT